MHVGIYEWVLGFRLLKSLLWGHKLKLLSLSLFINVSAGSRIYRRCVTNATVHPELVLSPSSQAAHPSILFLSQCQLTLSPRTVAQDRDFRVTVDTFLSLTWTVSGSIPPGPSRNFFSCQVHPDVPPSASKYNSPPRPLCALRLRGKLAPPSHPTVTGFMVRLLVQQS